MQQPGLQNFVSFSESYLPNKMNLLISILLATLFCNERPNTIVVKKIALTKIDMFRRWLCDVA